MQEANMVFFFLQGANSNLYCIGNYEIIIETFTGLEALNASWKCHVVLSAQSWNVQHARQIFQNNILILKTDVDPEIPFRNLRCFSVSHAEMRHLKVDLW